MLYTIFVVPGLVAPAAGAALGVASLMAIMIRNIGFALLVLYIVDLREERLAPPESRPRRATETALEAVAVAVVLALVGAGVSSIATLSSVGAQSTTPVTIARRALPLALPAMAAVGVTEELFFRAYFALRLRAMGFSPVYTAITAALLFAVGHAYQGIAALIFSLLAGVILMGWWFRTRNLIALATGHALYNSWAVISATLL